MVLAHSLAMNGGAIHAIETLSADELAAALVGYRYFALDAAAEALADIAQLRTVSEFLARFHREPSAFSGT